MRRKTVQARVYGERKGKGEERIETTDFSRFDSNAGREGGRERGKGFN